jgi:hypothetical protein
MNEPAILLHKAVTGHRHFRRYGVACVPQSTFSQTQRRESLAIKEQRTCSRFE